MKSLYFLFKCVRADLQTYIDDANEIFDFFLEILHLKYFCKFLLIKLLIQRVKKVTKSRHIILFFSY